MSAGYLDKIGAAYYRFLEAMQHRTTVVTIREEDVSFLAPDAGVDIPTRLQQFWDRVLWTYLRRDHSRFEKTLLQH